MKKTFVTILILSLPYMSWGQEAPKSELPKTIEVAGVTTVDLDAERTPRCVGKAVPTRLKIEEVSCRVIVKNEFTWLSVPGRYVLNSEEIVSLGRR